MPASLVKRTGAAQYLVVTRREHESPLAEVRRSRVHGRGVFATQSIAKNTLISRDPVLVVNDAGDELGIYVFDWGRGRSGLSLGLTSLLNHSATPNAYVISDGLYLLLYALCTIQADTEIFIDYGPNYALETA